jgi:general secretion pathway protein E
MRSRLGQLLEERGLVSPRDLNEALAVQANSGGLIGQILIRLGSISEPDLLDAVSEHLGVPVQASDEMPSPEALRAFLAETHTSHAWWAAREALAWHTTLDGEDSIVCVAVHPLDPLVRGLIEQTTSLPVRYRLAPRSLIQAALGDLTQVTGPLAVSGVTDARKLRELAQEAPVIDFVNSVFAEALQKRASDIHVEPFEDRFVVRLRIDGLLQTVRTAPRAGFDAVCSRVKLLSRMDIGERRIPQDGRQAVRVAGQEVDLRVSTLPAAWGESLVIRLLGKTSRLPELTELGLSESEARTLVELVDQPNGIVLMSGPTGSGKTTTIYRLLAHLNAGDRKIVTIEDPVELDLPGTVQVHVRSDIGFTFAAGLRSILRQDPDVIMVGEIRDPETARIAVQAALTGHMVISTVHTNSAIAAVPRLLDLGVEDYLLADVLRGVVGQRLVRKLCPQCSRPASPANRAGVRLKSEPGDDWREPVGCPACSGTGFRGRLGIYEMVVVSDDIQAGVHQRRPETDLIQAARAKGYRTMFEDGLLKCRRGLTTLSEVYRVAGASEAETETFQLA